MTNHTQVRNVSERNGIRKGRSFGETITLPPNFVFVRAGHAALTRRVKNRSAHVYVEMEKTKHGDRATGVWAPAAMVIAARRSLGLDVPQSLLGHLDHRLPVPLDWRVFGV